VDERIVCMCDRCGVIAYVDPYVPRKCMCGGQYEDARYIFSAMTRPRKETERLPRVNIRHG